MATKATRVPTGEFTADPYMELVRRFPLRPIRDDAEHARAVEIVAGLMGRDADAGTGDYLDTLVLLVNHYEDAHHTPAGADLSPREAVRALMAANGLSQADMGKVIGSGSALSMFLNGERELSKAHVKRLAARFHVDAGLFL